MRVRGIIIPAVLALVVASQPAKAADTAVELLFDRPYLAQVEPDTAIVYDYAAENANKELFGEAFTDTIKIRVEADETEPAKRSAMMDIFTGARERHIGPLPRTEGNPGIMIILEQDTFELERALGGMPAYFRNKIRAALRDGALVEPKTVTVDGKTVEAQRIVITPYARDPNFSKVPQFAATTYEFIMAGGVPGGIVSISSTVPDPGGGDKPLRRKSMTYAGTEKLGG